MDDEEEMAALRASSRYGGGRSAVDEPMSKEDDEMMRSFFPTSFGQEKKQTPKGKSFNFAPFAVPRPRKETSKSSGMAVIGRRGMQRTGPRVQHVSDLSDDEAGPLPLPPEPSAPSRLPSPPKSAPNSPRPSNSGRAPLLSEDSDSEAGTLFPITHEVVIPAHNRTVTAMAIDKHGANMVTGSIDGMLRYWDFNGMNRGMKPYREFIPKENHAVQALDFNERGNLILCIASDVHCRVFDREGSQTPVETTVLGDMYLRDMAVTKGHTKMLTDGVWHPKDSDVWISSSLDGTVRIWNLKGTKRAGMEGQLSQEHVLKTVDKRGVPMGATGRSSTGNEGVYPMTCRYSPDGKKIVVGCSDGSIQIFFDKARYVKPDKIVRDGHTGGVCNVHLFAEQMLSRSLDGTMKLWNVAAPFDPKKPPQYEWVDLPSESTYTSCTACPDNEYAITGTCAKKGGDVVKIFSLRTGKEECVTPVNDGATRIHWSAQINQIIVGTVKGGVAVKYNPKSSRSGAIEFLSKEERKNVKSVIDNELGYIPIAVPADDREAMRAAGVNLRRDGTLKEMTRQQRNRERLKANQKTITPPKPDALGDGVPGENGTKMSLRTKSYLDTFGKDLMTTDDAQKVLLSYNEDGKLDDYLFRAYTDTQPDKLLDYSQRDETEGDRLLKGRHCPKCGRKLCSCGHMKKEAEEREIKEERLQRQKANEARREAAEESAKRQKCA